MADLLALFSDPAVLADHADRDGGGARHRQPDLHFDPVEYIARGAAQVGAAHRHRAGAGDAAGAAGDDRLAGGADRTGGRSGLAGRARRQRRADVRDAIFVARASSLSSREGNAATLPPLRELQQRKNADYQVISTSLFYDISIGKSS